VNVQSAKVAESLVVTETALPLRDVSPQFENCELTIVRVPVKLRYCWPAVLHEQPSNVSVPDIVVETVGQAAEVPTETKHHNTFMEF
jgi:hypothetical protein